MKNKMELGKIDRQMVELLRSTAQELWDTAESIASSNQAYEEDWEAARMTLSHALTILQRPRPIR
jgi:hypothetical protein